MTNRVIIIGRLTHDPELRKTSSGKDVCSFTVAVDRSYKTQEGQNTDFFHIQAWDKTAEFVSSYLSKGRLISVDGRLQQRKYENKEGNTVETVEIVAERIDSLDRPKDRQEENEPKPSESKPKAQKAATPKSDDDYDPFADE